MTKNLRSIFEYIDIKKDYSDWQFGYNMIKTDMIDSVYPLPMTSTAANYLLKRFEIEADLIYIDAGHEHDEVYHDEVYTDLSLYYNLLRPGGVILSSDARCNTPCRFDIGLVDQDLREC